MHMKKIVIFSLLFFMYGSAYAEFNFKEGEWEIEVKQTVSGMPIANPPTIYRQCLTHDNPIPTLYLQARSCDLIDSKERRNSVKYKLNCFTDNGSIINEGKVQYRNRKISGRSKTDLGKVTGRDTVLGYSFKGHRIGECQ